MLAVLQQQWENLRKQSEDHPPVLHTLPPPGRHHHPCHQNYKMHNTMKIGMVEMLLRTLSSFELMKRSLLQRLPQVAWDHLCWENLKVKKGCRHIEKEQRPWQGSPSRGLPSSYDCQAQSSPSREHEPSWRAPLHRRAPVISLMSSVSTLLSKYDAWFF